MGEEKITRHERRRLEKLERASEVQKQQTRGRFHAVHVIGLVLIVGVVGAIVYGVRHSGDGASQPQSEQATYTDAPIHWHGAFEVDLCGKKQDFSSYGGSDHHAGLPLLHTHGDGVIHIEGRIIQKEDIALGRFFDSINIPFDHDKIMDKKNGDVCPGGASGKPGSVKMFVNGTPNNEFRDFVGNYTPDAKDNVIRIVFE